VAYPFHTDASFEAFFSGYILYHWNYIQSVYGVEPDRACKDISHVCLLCHDAGAKLRLVDPTIVARQDAAFSIGCAASLISTTPIMPTRFSPMLSRAETVLME